MTNGIHFRATYAEIDRDALQHNAKIARQVAGESRLLGVIKADGYGHGANTVAEAISSHVDAFAVAFIDEAIALRNAGFQQPIVLLEGCFSEAELPICAHYNFQPVVHQQQQLDAIVTARLARPLSVWLKVDTGMHRLGWPLADVQRVYRELRNCPQVVSVTLMSHFANADTSHALNQQQNDTFKQVCVDTQTMTNLSIANSAALVSTLFDTSHPSSQWVRCGIMLYGDNPSRLAQPPQPLRSAMRLVAPIMALREVKRGASVGYGSTWRADRDSLIATIAIGYADGYPRHAKNGTPVVVHNLEATLVGAVSMDMITVDVSDVANKATVRIGDSVELWGPNLPVARVAECANTISYELLTRVSARVPRRLK